MPETIAQILPVLQLLATAGGSGWLASWLIDTARRRWPAPTRAQWQAAGRWRQLLYEALHAPFYVRINTFFLAGLIAALASFAAAALSGADPIAAADMALAMVASQLRHGLGLSSAVPTRDDPTP